jgi:hypothetical protein
METSCLDILVRWFLFILSLLHFSVLLDYGKYIQTVSHALLYLVYDMNLDER